MRFFCCRRHYCSLLGDLTQKIAVSVSGEMLNLVNTFNNMIVQLIIFAPEVCYFAFLFCYSARTVTLKRLNTVVDIEEVALES